jgi:hypothetical protein
MNILDEPLDNVLPMHVPVPKLATAELDPDWVHPINPELKQLPLVDGCLFLDNSFMETLTTCARQAQYYYIDKKRLADQKSALFFGGAIHSALELRYRYAGRINPSVLPRAQRNLLKQIFDQSTIGLDDYRNYAYACSLIEGYNKRYPSEPFRLMVDPKGWPLVEQSFAIELCRLRVPDWVHPSGYVVIIYTGKIDMIVEWDGLFNWDHKTASIMGAGFFEEQRMSPQHEGYMWAAQKVFHTMLEGYVINGIRTRPPAKSRDAVIGDDFQRDKVYLPQERLVEWERNTIVLLDEFLMRYALGYMPMQKKWCVGKYGRCSYYEVCSLPAESRPLMLNSSMFVENTWSPLKHL